MKSVLDIYRKCNLCPNKCLKDRTVERGLCGELSDIRIAWSGLHRGEEPPVSGEKGSGMIFFTGCPLHCRYCQNIEISGIGNNYGINITIDELKNLMLSLEDMGAATINLVTGTHFIPSIIKALERAEESGLDLPIVWNSSGYEDTAALELIDPYIDIYLLDAKTLERNVSEVFCGGPRYPEIIPGVMDFVRERHPKTDMERMRGTIIRHLVFPGEIEATKNFLKFFAENYKDNFFLSLMTQFVSPDPESVFDDVAESEYDDLIRMLDELGIEEGYVQEPGGDDASWLPHFREDLPFPENFAAPSEYFLSLKRESLSR